MFAEITSRAEIEYRQRRYLDEANAYRLARLARSVRAARRHPSTGSVVAPRSGRRSRARRQLGTPAT